MAKTEKGVGLFTADNIVAVLKAIPKSNGTYRDITRQAQQYGVNISPHTISGWVNRGKADIKARDDSTAFARFAKQSQNLIAAYCGGGQPKPRTGRGVRSAGRNLRVRQPEVANSGWGAGERVPRLPGDRRPRPPAPANEMKATDPHEQHDRTPPD